MTLQVTDAKSFPPPHILLCSWTLNIVFTTSMVWSPETRFPAEKNVEFVSRSATDFSVYTWLLAELKFQAQ